jgi:hypothetical protein
MAKETQNTDNGQPDNEITTTNIIVETQEQRVKELKTKLGIKTVYILSIPDDETDEPLIAFLKKPSRQALSASMSRASIDPLQANEIILNDAWIEGDDRIRSEDNILSALASMQGLMSVKIGELKKL